MKDQATIALYPKCGSLLSEVRQKVSVKRQGAVFPDSTPKKGGVSERGLSCGLWQSGGPRIQVMGYGEILEAVTLDIGVSREKPRQQDGAIDKEIRPR